MKVTGLPTDSVVDGSILDASAPSPSAEFAYFEQVAQQAAAKRGSYEPDLSWRATASCRGTSPELFFPVGTTGLAVDQIADAKDVCRQCPAQEPCLEFALLTNQDSGVWGATSEEERRTLRRNYLRR